MATRTIVLIPPNGEKGQDFPGSIIQLTNLVPHIPYGAQERDNNLSQQNPPVESLAKLLKRVRKTLGAIQIITALIHFGFGTVSFFLIGQDYNLLAVFGGYPFWGGLAFIVSGSLSISTEKHLTPRMVNWMLGLHIISASVASIGIILYMVELALNYYPAYNYMSYSYQYPSWSKRVGTGLSVMLLLFSLLEFCITVFMGYFMCQTFCCNNEMKAMLAMHCGVRRGEVILVEGYPAVPPPAYDTLDFSPSKNQGEIMRSDSIAISPSQLS
ncbi:membrane-spanning 4-domains subfamily A member 8-like [Anolis sagrei]|uniref:membrane-spanning 4-domains subfamily A member 8-like n=1 Tax=Anolis sagrei TaxID=38937 RepID=UPI003522BBA8